MTIGGTSHSRSSSVQFVGSRLIGADVPIDDLAESDAGDTARSAFDILTHQRRTLNEFYTSARKFEAYSHTDINTTREQREEFIATVYWDTPELPECERVLLQLVRNRGYILENINRRSMRML